MKTLLLVVLMLSALPACTNWPEEGRGGFAERRAIIDPNLQSLADRFARQRQLGAETFAAGLTDEAKTAFVRAQRNNHAGIGDDFVRDLEHLKSLLDQIDQHIHGR